MGHAARNNPTAVDARAGIVKPRSPKAPRTIRGYVWPTDVLMKKWSQQLGFVGKKAPVMDVPVAEEAR